MPTMWDDGFSSSHPLAVKVITRAEILASAFDKIKLSKRDPLKQPLLSTTRYSF